MGDLKKKKPDCIQYNENEKMQNECEMRSSDVETIERLREYLKEFYKIQLEKQKKEKNEKENEK